MQRENSPNEQLGKDVLNLSLEDSDEKKDAKDSNSTKIEIIENRKFLEKEVNKK